MAKKKTEIAQRKRAKSTSLNQDQAIATLAANIKDDIHHRDYKRVTDLAILYSQLITGIGCETLLKQFVQRETEEMFKQRVDLTEHITPAVAATVMSPWYKIPRVNPVIKNIDFENSKDDDARVSELKGYVANFYGQTSVEDYLAQRYIDLNGTDPNAFMRVAFDAFDNKKEKASPYPEEISASEAVNFKYTNNELIWLISKYTINYLKISTKDKPKPDYQEGVQCRIFTFDQAVEFTQVDIDTPGNFTEGAITVIPGTDGTSTNYFLIDKTRLFTIEVFNHKAGMVPAFRVGVKKDLSTNGRTCVNMFHAALPFFKKTIKTVSEMDLTMALHAYLQKISYQPKCPGTKNNPCMDGALADGKTKCSICKGTGLVVTTTTQDFITFRLPKDPEKMLDLSKIVHYVQLPIDTPKFQDEYIEKLERKAVKAVYNSETIINDTIVKTATEKFIDLDSVYDALQPLSTGYAAAYIKTVTLVAIYTELGEGLIVEYQLPKDMKLKTLSQNLTELKLASESGAPTFVKQEIINDITTAIFADRKDDLKKLKTKQLFDPGDGKTETEIQFIISNQLWRRQDMVLYAEFKSIFQELEEEQNQENEAVWFYDLSTEKQTEKVKAKVEQYLTLIDQEKPKPIPTFNLGGQ